MSRAIELECMLMEGGWSAEQAPAAARSILAVLHDAEVAGGDLPWRQLCAPLAAVEPSGLDAALAGIREAVARANRGVVLDAVDDAEAPGAVDAVEAPGAVDALADRVRKVVFSGMGW